MSLRSLRVLLPSVWMLALSLAAVGDAPSRAGHAIAYELDDCMEQVEWRPEEGLACARTAEEQWRAEVERLTARLGSVLGSEAREALREADLAWQQSRDADLALIEAYYAQLEAAQLGEPELLPLARQLHRNALFEARVDQLRRLLDGLESLSGGEQ